jgi:hypothetical protein
MITSEHLETFRAKLETHCQKLYSDMGLASNAPTIEIMPAIKYARIVRKSPHASAYGFIEMSTGNIYYSAGWKAPQKNHVRGNILAENCLDCCGWSAVKTLR